MPKQWLGNRLEFARASHQEGFEKLSVSESKDDRSPGVKAYAMASQAIATAGTMLVPGLIGLGADRWFETRAVFTIVGFGLGLVFGIWQIIQLNPLE